ncbi:hypothetical protein [uncultured Pelagimonas sp.]|uniref:hypothetical protein n=1 Tax=uncultured Pelagimonas sp. TaxID=1618102 RepID=UPI0026136F3C|nr:hypothetical protein [uncultured Pelagimonas sp.]
MHLVKALMMALLALCCVSTSAVAQGRWEAFDNANTGFKGAVVCPVDDKEQANYFCYMVGCQNQKTLAHRIFFHGEVLPETLQARVLVDGNEAGRMTFTHTGQTDYEDYHAPYDLAAHGSLIGALKSGTRAELVLMDGTSGEVVNRTAMSLRGSSKALDSAARQCALPPPPPVQEPLALAKAKVEKDCRTFGGSVTVQDGAVIKEDFDRDGLLDQVIDYAQITCDKAASLFCGSAGCPMEFYRQQQGGGFVRIGGGHMYGYQVTVKPVITLNLHGSACGKIGAAGCSKSFTVENNDLVPLK